MRIRRDALATLPLPRFGQLPRENADFPAADCEVMVGWASQHEAANSNASVQVKNFIGHIPRESMPLTVTGESAT
jgi:hypothetical protein